MIHKECACGQSFVTIDPRVSMCEDCYRELESQHKYEEECEEREDNLRHDYEQTHYQEEEEDEDDY